MDILLETEKIEEYILELRRYFHMNPELSWQEYKTADKICEELDSMGIEYDRVLNTGIIATIEGNSPKPILGIRADMDALPVTEETDLNFKSCNEGVMHACGHDTHIAMALGAAKILSENRDRLNCSVRIIFQPAEEDLKISGALKMVEFEKVREIDNIVAIHIWSLIDANKFSIETGPMMASSDKFIIKIIGKGGHGAMPNESVDPILVSAAVINNLQSIVSRESSPLEPVVLSVCSIHGGTSANVIPEEVVLEGTIRAFDPRTRERVLESMERIVENTCYSLRADYEFTCIVGTQAVINDEFSSQIGREAVSELYGEDHLYNFGKSMGSEDFSEMLNIIPGIMVFLGGRNVLENKDFPHHNSRFDIDESSLKYGVGFLVNYILKMQDRL